MSEALAASPLAAQDRQLAGTFAREARRLRGFIRHRVADADDILQDVFSELIEATRLATPIEHVGAWLFRVAANRITDRFRRKGPPVESIRGGGNDAGDHSDRSESAVDARPAATADGPEARYASHLLLDDLQAALAALPAAQREVFVAHELEGRSFASLAAESGTPVNTLLARKRYAVLQLRQRLQPHRDGT